MIVAKPAVLPEHTQPAVQHPPQFNALVAAGGAHHPQPPRQATGRIGNTQREQVPTAGHRRAEIDAGQIMRPRRVIRCAGQDARRSERRRGQHERGEQGRQRPPPRAPARRPCGQSRRRVSGGSSHPRERCRPRHRLDSPSQATSINASRSGSGNRASAARTIPASLRPASAAPASTARASARFSRSRRASPRRSLASTRRATPYSHGNASAGTSSIRREATTNVSLATSSATTRDVRRRPYASTAA